jgi:hypothetical protein
LPTEQSWNFASEKKFGFRAIGEAASHDDNPDEAKLLWEMTLCCQATTEG